MLDFDLFLTNLFDWIVPSVFLENEEKRAANVINEGGLSTISEKKKAQRKKRSFSDITGVNRSTPYAVESQSSEEHLPPIQPNSVTSKQDVPFPQEANKPNSQIELSMSQELSSQGSPLQASGVIIETIQVELGHPESSEKVVLYDFQEPKSKKRKVLSEETACSNCKFRKKCETCKQKFCRACCMGTMSHCSVTDHMPADKKDRIHGMKQMLKQAMLQRKRVKMEYKGKHDSDFKSRIVEPTRWMRVIAK